MKTLISALKYFATLTIALLLLWLVYKEQDLSQIIGQLKHVDYHWVIYSLMIAIASHIARAYRWNLLIEPMGYRMKTFRTFLAVMVGYFANLLVPRMGEVSRCAILKKTDNVRMTSSIGAVLAERVFDLLLLILVVLIAFILEFSLLNQYVFGVIENTLVRIGRNLIFIYVAGAAVVALGLAVFIFIRKYKNKLKNNRVFLKVRRLLRELTDGLTSIRRMKNLSGFVISSLIIWVCYYFMTYLVFFSMPETSHLGFVAGMSLLAMGSLGMVAPVQGGIGAYHALVAGTLIFYGISEQDSAFFALLLHTSQVLMIIAVGGVSFILSLLIKRRDAKIEEKLEESVLSEN